MLKKKLKCVLLIDDDDPTNFLHEIVLRDSGCTERVVTKTSGQDALDFLTTKEEGEYVQPEIIFLDINMPGMNGWEFLEKYNKLEEGQKGEIVVVMLTTSLNPDDKEKAVELLGSESAFRTKPLDEEMIKDVLRGNFPNRF